MRQDLYQELFEVENQHWWHQHKRAVVHQFVKKYAHEGRVLDVGAGTGKMLVELKKKKWQVFGVDSEKEALFWAKKRGIKLKQVDLEKEKLPFAKDTFELVLTLDLLEHLKDEKRILKEIKRVLKPQGVLVITVPSYPWLYSYWDKMLGHQRRYSKSLLRNKCKKAGLEPKYVGYFCTLFLGPALIVRMIKSLRKRTQEISDFQTTPLKTISIPLIKLYGRIERLLLKFFKLPFGLSILCVARKSSTKYT